MKTTIDQTESEEKAMAKFYADTKFADELGSEAAIKFSQTEVEQAARDDAKPEGCRARRKALRAAKFGGSK